MSPRSIECRAERGGGRKRVESKAMGSTRPKRMDGSGALAARAATHAARRPTNRT